MFENNQVHGIHKHRYFVSFVKAGGDIRNTQALEDWLKSLPINLSSDEIEDIVDMARAGKIELEIHASEFLKTYNSSFRE